MPTTIKATRFVMTPETESYLQERLSALEKLIDLSDTTLKCDVELSRETGHQHGDIWRAEINLAHKGEVVRVVADGESIHAAIDAAKDEMTSRLRRSKDKLVSTLRRSGVMLKRWLRFGRE